jgi:GH24 family phage-related lysozyme (muramidase)
MEQGLLSQVIAELSQDEGRRDRLYNDLTGDPLPPLPALPNGSQPKRTIGVGWNLDDNPLPPEVIDLMLTISIKRAEYSVKRIFPEYEGYSRNRKAALINALFNIGEGGFLKFRNTIRHIRAGSWHEAARHLRLSLWARQVQKSRSERIIQQIERG